MAALILEEKFNRELQRKIKQYADDKVLDYTTIAKGINRSPSAVSLYVSGKYTGRVDELTKELENYIKAFEENAKVEYKSLSFVETQVTKRFNNTANLCKARSKMAALIGSPGIGKTTSAKAYQAISTGVIIIEPTERTSARAILEKIAKLLKVAFQNNTSQDELINIISKRLERNLQLIIVDEAENLNVNGFNVLRKLYDKGNCGVLFLGTEELQGLLMKIRSGFPYITSRIGYFERLDALKLDDIKKLVIQYFPECNENLIKYIAKVSNYNARKLQNVLDLSLDITNSANIEVNEEVIASAAEKLI